MSFEYTSDQWANIERLLRRSLQLTTDDVANLIVNCARPTLYRYETKIKQVMTKAADGNLRGNGPSILVQQASSPKVQPHGNLLECEPIDAIRCILECEASEFQSMAKSRSDPNRKANRVEAEKVICSCDFILSALSADRAGSLGQSIKLDREWRRSPNPLFFHIAYPRHNLDEIANKIEALRNEAKLTVLTNSTYSRMKTRQTDLCRDCYLDRLCVVWVSIRGTPTTSFNARTGRAAGNFVNFLELAAHPALKQGGRR
jgi:hypothetical protein